MKKKCEKSSTKRQKRQTKKYAGLSRDVNRKNLKEFIDFDYIDKLTDKEKDFLDRFCKEDYSADFSHDRTITKSKKKRREIYRNNNKRNQDTFSYFNSFGKLDELQENDIHNNPEDAIIRILDRFVLKKKS